MKPHAGYHESIWICIHAYKDSKGPGSVLAWRMWSKDVLIKRLTKEKIDGSWKFLRRKSSARQVLKMHLNLTKKYDRPDNGCVCTLRTELGAQSC